MLPLLLCAGLSLTVTPARAELSKKTAALVRQLGDPAFRKREEAARQLVELGGLSRPALEAAFKNPDVEIRNRARLLVPQVVEVDVRRQFARFVADASGTARVNLPGWKVYRDAVGDDPAARKLFADIFRDNLDLLGELESNPGHTWQAYAQRTMETQMAIQAQWNVPRRRGVAPPPPYTVDIHQFAALMLIGMDDGVHKAREKAAEQPANGPGMAANVFAMAENYPLAQFMTEDYFRNYVTAHAEAPRFKKLFLGWLEAQARLHRGGSYEMYSVMEAIKNTRLAEAVGFVERAVKSKETPTEVRAQGMLCLGVIGGKNHLALLEPLLKDKTQVSSFNVGGGNGNKQYTCELRDVALGVTIRLNGEKPSRYGFEGFTVFGGGDNDTQYYAYSFTAEEKRKVTFQKWADFVADKAKKEKEKKGQ